MLIGEHFVFLHMPKTAGGFVADALSGELSGTLRRGAPGIAHPDWDDIPPEAGALPVLVFVRNPWDWYVSWYHYVLASQRTSLMFRSAFGGGRHDFATTVRNACTGGIEHGRAAVMERVAAGADFYTARFDTMLGTGVDSARLTVGRYESLVEDLDAFLEAAEVPRAPDFVERVRARAPVRVSRRGPYADYYDAELRDLVGTCTSRIVERFGYAF